MFPKQAIRVAVVDYCQNQALIERNPEIRGLMIIEIYGTPEDFLDVSEEQKTQAILAHCQKQRESGTYATTEFMKGNIDFLKKVFCMYRFTLPDNFAHFWESPPFHACQFMSDHFMLTHFISMAFGS